MKILNKTFNRFRYFKKKYYWRCYIHGDRKRLKMGSGCILNDCLFNTRSGSIVLGDNVKISHNVMILTGKHDFFNPGFPVVSHGMDIKIGSNVWIGAGSIILGRVCIGDNVIVGAGSIVTKDVPSNCMVCCDPARVIKEVSV